MYISDIQFNTFVGKLDSNHNSNFNNNSIINLDNINITDNLNNNLSIYKQKLLTLILTILRLSLLLILRILSHKCQTIILYHQIESTILVT